MTKSEQLITIFARTVESGGGIHTTAELAFMLNEPPSTAFNKFLSDCVKKGLIRRLANGIFESTVTPPNGDIAIYQISKKLRNNVLNYISFESQLSYLGEISQILIDRITIATKGRSGIFETPYGVIEFTHTKKATNNLFENIYFDPTIKMYRATKEQALADLKNSKRNVHMLENNNVE